MNFIRNALEKYNRIFIYGAGDYGRCTYDLISNAGFSEKISAFVETNCETEKKIYEIRVISLSELESKTGDAIIVAVSEQYESSILEKLTGVSADVLRLTDFVVVTEDLYSILDLYRSYSEEMFAGRLFDWCIQNRILQYDSKEKLFHSFINKHATIIKEICVVVGSINARMARIIRAFRRKGILASIIEYRPFGFPEYTGNSELRKAGFNICRCYSVEEVLFEALCKSKGLCFVEPAYTDSAIAEILIRFRKFYGKIIFTTYDPYIGTYYPVDNYRFESEKYCMENADGIVWRYYSKDYLSEKFGINYSGPSIHFSDCTEISHTLSSENTNDDILKLCCIPTHAVDILETESINGFTREAHIDEIMKAIGNNIKVRLDVFLWDASDDEIAQLDGLTETFENFNYFIHVQHDELMERLGSYDYGISLMTRGEIPVWPETNDGIHTEAAFRYSMSNKFFEFLSAGLPIVSTFGEMQCDELEKEGGLIRMDLDSLDVLYLTNEKNSFKKKALAARGKYSIDKEIVRLIDFFKKVGATNIK